MFVSDSCCSYDYDDVDYGVDENKQNKTEHDFYEYQIACVNRVVSCDILVSSDQSHMLK